MMIHFCSSLLMLLMMIFLHDFAEDAQKHPPERKESELREATMTMMTMMMMIILDYFLQFVPYFYHPQLLPFLLLHLSFLSHHHDGVEKEERNVTAGTPM